jgi:hypothetical protein
MTQPPRPAPKPAPATQPETAGEATRQRSLKELQALGYSAVPRARAGSRGRAVSAAQAAMGSGVLAPLLRQAREAQQCLAQLASVLPPALLSLVDSGPLENGEWTLLVSHSAAAAKIRQWTPALAAHVRSKGWPVERIVVKVLQK